MTKIITTSGDSYLNLFIRDNLEKHPEVFTITDATVADVEAHGKKVRAERDAANPPKPEPIRTELNRLRSRLFDLQQNVKNTEIRVNNTAGYVKEFEKRITDAIKEKQQYEESGNLLAARGGEHRVQLLENELADMRDRLAKEQRDTAFAARALREWKADNDARLKELQKEVAKLPENNADTYAKELEKSFRK